MNCTLCGGQLVMRETYDYPIDDNGVWTKAIEDSDYEKRVDVHCVDCGALHEHEQVSSSFNAHTIAMKLNTDPKPVATLAIAFRGGEIEAIGSDALVHLTAIDETRQEIGRFFARRDSGSAWWVRVKRLSALIQKGQHKASFRGEGEAKDE